MRTVASTVAVAAALFLAQATSAFTQTTPGGPGTSGGAAPPNQVPSGGTVQSTTPPENKGPAAASGSGTVGRSGRATQLQDPKEDPIVRETEREVSRRIKNICKGC